MIEFRKILCPIDLDDNSLSALEYARDIAQKNAAKLYLLNVARILAADMDTPVAIGPHPHWEQAAQGRLDQIAGEWLEGRVAYEVIVRGGIPETVIVEVAAEFDIDLIVMRTHGRTGLAHFILGSVAETVIREAGCPVLTVKPKPIAGEHSAGPRKP
jgi:nucleotide-binding universal stress UspA family protein